MVGPEEQARFEELGRGINVNFDKKKPERAYASVLEIGDSKEGHPYLLDILLGWGNLKAGTAGDHDQG